MLVEYTYPWLPTKCLKCDKLGYTVKACPLEKEIQREKLVQVEEGELKENHIEEKEEGEIEIEKIHQMIDDTEKRDKEINIATIEEGIMKEGEN